MKQLLFAILFFTASSFFSQNWRGTINSDWNNPSNWSAWPLNNQSILIDPANYTGAAANPVINSNSAFVPSQLIIQNGAQLTSFANLSVAGRIEIFGAGTSVTISSGTLQSTGSGSQGRIIIGEDAVTTLNGGVLRSSQRIIAEFGGQLVVNSGTLNPLAELALVDGSINNNSNVIVNGGFVNVGSMLEFENENGVFEPSFKMNGGNLFVGSDIFWLGVTPGAGTPRFLMSGGTATVNGNIVNDPASTVNLFLKISGNSAFNFNGNQIDLPFPGDSLIQQSNSVFHINSSLSMNINGVCFSNGGSFNFNGNTSLAGTGNYTLHNITIQQGKTLTQTTPALLTVNGNINNNGTFLANNKTVSLSGIIPQNLGGNNPLVFSTLLVSNTSTAGITLNTPLTVSDSLILSTGIVNTSAVNGITIADNAFSGQGNPGSYINGPMIKIGNDAFVFPVGKNGRWRRISMSAPQNLNAGFTAEYFTDSYGNPNNVISPLTAASNIEYWTLSKNSVADSVQTALYWEDAMQSGITNCGQISIAKWNTNSWTSLPSSPNGSCSGNGAGTIQSNNHINSSSVLTFGFLSGVFPQNIILCQGQTLQVANSTYSTSGSYVDILSNINQQDSVILTNLTILAPITKSQTVSICAGDIFTVGSNVYSVSGIYSDTLIAGSGCDSIVQTNLTVKPPVNVQVQQSGIVLSATNVNANAYQWINCSTNLAIPGATTSVFTASQNGFYSVILTENGCSDTSACLQINSVNLLEKDLLVFKAFPNPVDNELTIEFTSFNECKIELTDLAGRLIEEHSASGKLITLNYSHIKSGVYIVKVSNALQSKQIRLLID